MRSPRSAGPDLSTSLHCDTAIETRLLSPTDPETAYGTTATDAATRSFSREPIPVSRARPRSHLLRSLLSARSWTGPRHDQSSANAPSGFVSLVTYSARDLDERHCVSLEELRQVLRVVEDDSSTSCWICVPAQPDEELRAFLLELGIPSRTLAEAAHPVSRARAELYEDAVCITSHTPVVTGGFGEIARVPERRPSQLALVMLPARRMLVSLHEAAPPRQWLLQVLAVLQANVASVRRRPVSHLLCAMLDAVLEMYFTSLEMLGEVLDGVEHQILREGNDEMTVRGDDFASENRPFTTRQVLRRICTTKHDLALLRRQIWPMRECLTRLAVAPDTLVDSEARLRVRESLDRAMQVLDVLECYRDVGHALLDLHLAAQNNRMQEVMQTLAVVTTIFVPLTFLAGIEGMNFKNQPELRGQWSYVVFWVVVTVILAGQIVFFRRKGWI